MQQVHFDEGCFVDSGDGCEYTMFFSSSGAHWARKKITKILGCPDGALDVVYEPGAGNGHLTAFMPSVAGISPEEADQILCDINSHWRIGKEKGDHAFRYVVCSKVSDVPELEASSANETFDLGDGDATEDDE
jgi:hypothetical protein